MVEMTVLYEAELRCTTTHGPSGVQLVTDAPVDNCGKGASFSPTDLVAVALGTCMLTTMGIFAERHGIDLRSSRVRVRKIMTQEAPRKIACLEVDLDMPISRNHPHAGSLEKAALNCPVHKSLHPDVQIPVNWNWAGSTLS